MIREIPIRRPSRAVASAVLLPVVALVLAGCGGASASGTGSATASTAPPGGQASAAGRGAGRGPAASGEIAAASPGVLQVQNSTSQTTVTYTKSTRFSQTVSTTVAVGDCVTATGSPASGSSNAITASAVRVFPTVNGNCRLSVNGAGGGRSGGPGTGGSRTPPPGLPSRAPGAGSGGNGGTLAVAFGKVTSVSGSAVAVAGTLRRGFPRSASPSASPASPASVSVTVTLTASTTVTKTTPATSAAAQVGKCATAEGKTDSTGAVAATSIMISTKGPNGCSVGFGRRPGVNGNGGDNG